MTRPPPLAWLRTFACAAEHGSFTKAAQQLNLTQAAVSKQMRALEQSLQQPLFHRQAHGIQLTELGQRYWMEVRAALLALDGATEDLFGLRQRNSVQLRVNISFAHWLLQPQLPALFAQLPQQHIELTHTVWDVNREPIGGDIDIRYGLPPWAGFEAMRLTRDQLLPVGARNTSQPPADCPIIHILGYRSGWAWYARESGHAHWLQRPQISVDNSVIAYQMAAQGLGVVLARKSFLSHPWTAAHLRPLTDAPTLTTEEGFFALRKAHAQQNQAVQIIWDWLKITFAQ